MPEAADLSAVCYTQVDTKAEYNQYISSLKAEGFPYNVNMYM